MGVGRASGLRVSGLAVQGVGFRIWFKVWGLEVQDIRLSLGLTPVTCCCCKHVLSCEKH